MKKTKARLYFLLFLLGILASGNPLSAKGTLASVPFELYGEHIFIRLSINGSEPLNFIFDTGAASTVISQQKASRIKLSSDGFTSVRTNKGPALAYYSKYNKLRVGELSVDNIRISQLTLDHLDKALERRVDGIIGHDLLKRFVIMVNYDKFALDIYDPVDFQPPQNFTAHQVELISGRPYIHAALTLANGEVLKGKLQIDNGSGSSITVYSPFVDAHKLFTKVGRTELIYTMSFAGLIDKNYAGRLTGLDVGNYQMTNVPIRLNRSEYQKRAFKDGVGHIGNGLLKRFNIAFDYTNGITYWYPNNSFVEEFKDAYSGLVVKSDQKKDRIFIKYVFDNSPASVAGLAKDDEIVMINNIKTEGRSSYEVSGLLNQTARNIEIVVKRNNELKKLSLQPKTL
ncbi:aspartyl protease family protein [Catalinimonas niigatensis]|uniref:aspartyl protease family protein n=1 Tax=Catalinimonas niigatensis TaxID=1397264 RepID=UPI0026656307|nr:aspartyl protease family protein [Catalinimonas niigatensis]WPP52565.1 aspartyl protease family protein [Catalinimonas niigatensis]